LAARAGIPAFGRHAQKVGAAQTVVLAVQSEGHEAILEAWENAGGYGIV